MKPLKRLLALTLALVAVLALCSNAGAIEAGASCACVVDYDTGRVLFEQNSHETRPIASITKIMTGYLACEYGDANDTMRSSPAPATPPLRTAAPSTSPRGTSSPSDPPSTVPCCPAATTPP
jgi:D-alanyl-D-alanine carboxypeptidase